MTSTKYSPNSGDGVSLDAVTTGTGRAFALNDCRQIFFTCTGTGTISAGEVTIEAANTIDYSGTWNEIEAVDVTTLTGGGQYGNTYPNSYGAFVRGRVTDNLTGTEPTVTVTVNGLLG